MRKYICGPGQGNLADLDMCDEECKVSEEGTILSQILNSSESKPIASLQRVYG